MHPSLPHLSPIPKAHSPPLKINPMSGNMSYPFHAISLSVYTGSHSSNHQHVSMNKLQLKRLSDDLGASSKDTKERIKRNCREGGECPLAYAQLQMMSAGNRQFVWAIKQNQI